MPAFAEMTAQVEFLRKKQKPRAQKRQRAIASRKTRESSRVICATKRPRLAPR
jgi:hypothetical protein